MVGKGSLCRKFLPGIILALLLLLFVSLAGAQGLQDEQSFSLEEETLIEINNAGDAHITDTITYDPDWFDQYGFIFEDNPSLLSRRYRSDSNVGEVENFDADIDYRKSTVAVSFDTPGLVYNEGDKWKIYGYKSYDLSSSFADEVELEASGVLNNEFTLFENMSVDETITFDLPDSAANASFDKGTGNITYELPYVTKSKGGFLADNKTIFTIIFALVMALSLLLFLFAVTRKTAAPAAAASVAPAAPGMTEGVPPEAPALSARPPTSAPPAPAAGQPAAPQVSTVSPPAVPDLFTGDQVTTTEVSTGEPAEAPASLKFCKSCGHPRAKSDAKFCKSCGAPFG